jgi:hypothetical protein
VSGIATAASILVHPARRSVRHGNRFKAGSAAIDGAVAQLKDVFAEQARI